MTAIDSSISKPIGFPSNSHNCVRLRSYHSHDLLTLSYAINWAFQIILEASATTIRAGLLAGA